MQTAISVKKVSKTFLSRMNAFKEPSLALNQLSFKVFPGEKVALIGPSGSGKSTILKILAGILLPSSGEVKIFGKNPGDENSPLRYKIGTLFGQRSHLWHHLPPIDSFALLAKIYEISPKEYVKRVEELIHIFDVVPFLQKPVKELSFEQRMRCELIASLIHLPDVLLLDEPTFGLDMEAKEKIRSILHTLSSLYGISLIVSCMDTTDIESVCSRALVLDKGSLLLDSPLNELKNAYSSSRNLSLDIGRKKLVLDLPGISITENDNHKFQCKIDTKVTSIEEVLQKALHQTSVKNLSLRELSTDEIVKILYGKKRSV